MYIIRHNPTQAHLIVKTKAQVALTIGSHRNTVKNNEGHEQWTFKDFTVIKPQATFLKAFNKTNKSNFNSK